MSREVNKAHTGLEATQSCINDADADPLRQTLVDALVDLDRRYESEREALNNTPCGLLRRRLVG
jgi:hypothetical protein